MKRRTRDLWLLRLSAAVIAVVLWTAVHGGKKTDITKRVTLKYELPQNLVLVSTVPQEAIVRLEGPGVLMRDIEDRNLSFTVDLRNRSADDTNPYHLDATELKLPSSIKVVELKPAQFPIKLDRMTSKWLAVRASFGGQLPDGFRVKSVTLTPSTVLARGARSRLSSVDSIPTETVALSANSLKQEFDVSLNLSEVSGLTVEEKDRFVRVVAEIDGKMSQRWVEKIEVGVMVRKKGASEPEPIRDRSMIQLVPRVVNFLVEGPEQRVMELKKDDINVWVELEDVVPGSLNVPISWRIPPELRVVRRSVNQIKVNIKKDTR